MRLCSTLFVLLAACDPAPAPAPVGARTEMRAPTPALAYVEYVSGGAAANARLPTVVAVHGLGDTPESFLELFHDFPLEARFVAPRAPIPWGPGFAWMTTRVRDGQEAALAREIDASADRLVALIERLRTRSDVAGAPVVAGFSQGGILTYAVRVKRPDLVRAALPVAGLLPEAHLGTLRRCQRGEAPIVAFHGESDVVVPFERDRVLVDRLRALGCDVTLQSFPGVRHLIPPEVRQSLYDALARAITPTR